MNILCDALPLFEGGGLLQTPVRDAQFFVAFAQLLVRAAELFVALAQLLVHCRKLFVFAVDLNGKIEHKEVQHHQQKVVERARDQADEIEAVAVEKA